MDGALRQRSDHRRNLGRIGNLHVVAIGTYDVVARQRVEVVREVILHLTRDKLQVTRGRHRASQRQLACGAQQQRRTCTREVGLTLIVEACARDHGAARQQVYVLARLQLDLTPGVTRGDGAALAEGHARAGGDIDLRVCTVVHTSKQAGGADDRV